MIQAKQKKWLVLVMLTLAMIVGALFATDHKGNVSEAAEQTKVTTKELLDEKKYSEIIYSNRLWMALEDKSQKSYAIVNYDGTVHNIDNSSGTITELWSFSSSGTAFNLIRAYSGQKETILNQDGSFFGGLQGYYDTVGFLNEYKDRTFYYTDETKIYVSSENGTQLFSVDLPVQEELCNMVDLGNYYCAVFMPSYEKRINFGGYSSYPCQGFVWNKNGELIKSYDTVYPTVDSLNSYGFEEVQDGGIYNLYDVDLQVVATQSYGSHEDNYDNILSEAVQKHSEGRQDNWKKYTSLFGSPNIPEEYSQSFDKIATNMELGDYDLQFYAQICGRNYYEAAYDFVKNEGYLNKFVFDESGNRVGYSLFGKDMIVTRNENGYYNIVKYVSITSTPMERDEKGILTATVVAGASQEYQFTFTAAEGVVPTGSSISVQKYNDSSTTVKNAKVLLKDIVNPDKIHVFDINLFNVEGVKIQPEGNIQVTVNVPEGFDVTKLAVYRINDDGSYTDLGAVVTDGKLIFETNHFSTYVIAEKLVKSTSPKTGESETINISLIFMIFFGTTVFYIFARERRNFK